MWEFASDTQSEFLTIINLSMINNNNNKSNNEMPV